MEQLHAFWKYLLSFGKSEWTLHDYPVRVRKQQDADATGDVPTYCAQIINWWVLVGLGNSEEEALAALKQALGEFKVNGKVLPRPGTKVPIQFASTQEVDAHAETAAIFLEEVLGFAPGTPVFISDGSSLFDFEGVNGGIDMDQKVKEVFGVDITDIDDRNLNKIFERIEQSAN